jgi:hypothetical protein
MSADHHETHPHHHRKMNAVRAEHILGVVVSIAVIALVIWLIYGLMNTGSTPSYLQ